MTAARDRYQRTDAAEGLATRCHQLECRVFPELMTAGLPKVSNIQTDLSFLFDSWTPNQSLSQPLAASGMSEDWQVSAVNSQLECDELEQIER